MPCTLDGNNPRSTRYIQGCGDRPKGQKRIQSKRGKEGIGSCVFLNCQCIANQDCWVFDHCS